MAKSRNDAIAAVEEALLPFSQAEPYLRCLVYGRNGTEKTRFGATGPDVVLLDINERGTKSVRDFPGYVFHARKDADIEYFFWYLKYGKHRHRTVVIDNLTTMQNMTMGRILKKAENRDPNRPPKTPQTKDWGTLRTIMEERILDFRNLDMHVVFLCQERKDKNAEEDAPEWIPDLSPAVRAAACGAVEIIGRTFKRKIRVGDPGSRKERKIWVPLMLVGPHEDYVTKDRTGNLPDVVVRPTVPKFIAASEAAAARRARQAKKANKKGAKKRKKK